MSSHVDCAGEGFLVCVRCRARFQDPKSHLRCRREGGRVSVPSQLAGNRFSALDDEGDNGSIDLRETNKDEPINPSDGEDGSLIPPVPSVPLEGMRLPPPQDNTKGEPLTILRPVPEGEGRGFLAGNLSLGGGGLRPEKRGLERRLRTDGLGLRDGLSRSDADLAGLDGLLRTELDQQGLVYQPCEVPICDNSSIADTIVEAVNRIPKLNWRRGFRGHNDFGGLFPTKATRELPDTLVIPEGDAGELYYALAFECYGIPRDTNFLSLMKRKAAAIRDRKYKDLTSKEWMALFTEASNAMLGCSADARFEELLRTTGKDGFKRINLLIDGQIVDDPTFVERLLRPLFPSWVERRRVERPIKVLPSAK